MSKYFDETVCLQSEIREERLQGIAEDGQEQGAEEGDVE